MAHIWMRAEVRESEQRAPLVPGDAARLVAAGTRITVEEAPHRAFDIADYAAAGCEVAPSGSWPDAPVSAYVLGIKELPDDPADLRHVHVYFAHAYKGQAGSRELLDRFARGGGELLDVEYLTLAGRRVVAFGRWAGYVGAALGVLAARGALPVPLRPTDRPSLDALLAPDGAGRPGRSVPALVTGAGGRSGRGAVEALTVAGSPVTGWDVSDTRDLDRPRLLGHELLVNCVVTREPAEPFVRPEDLTGDRALRVVADVTCDVTSELNLVPVNTAVTTWAQPARRVAASPPLDVIAIDNLPSLLPRESSESFSADLAPLIADLDARAGAWVSAAAEFARHR